MLTMVDVIRIDHFRGFEAYWEIPAEEPTAIKGQWVKGPNAALFEAIRNALGGNLPVIAEDLGVITDEVTALRTYFNLPGMRVIQFAFGGDSSNHFLPHNYDVDSVVYTGTHDNETTMGWYLRSDTTGTTDDPEVVKREREFAKDYAGIADDSNAHWDFIRLALNSVAQIALFPMQDLFGLGNEARMNYPSSLGGNWQWRMEADQITDDVIEKLARLTTISGRAHDNNH